MQSVRPGRAARAQGASGWKAGRTLHGLGVTGRRLEAGSRALCQVGKPGFVLGSTLPLTGIVALVQSLSCVRLSTP